MARGPTARTARPGGNIIPFCDPLTVTSMLQASCCRSVTANDETASTKSIAGWPESHIALPIDSISVVTPVEVSLCTMQTAFIAASSSNCRITSSGLTPMRGFHSTCTTSIPNLLATFAQVCAKKPCSNKRTRSPGESVLVIAASHAPLPEAGYIKTSCSVLKRQRSPSKRRAVRSANSGPR